MRHLLCLLAITFTLSADVPRFTSAAPQTDLWISHLTRFVAEHPGLTSEQKAIVDDGRELLENGLLTRLRSTDSAEAADARRELASFKARATDAFSRDLYSEAFVRLAQPDTKKREMYPYCDCNPGGGECFGECVTGSCRVMPDGCGLFGTDICTGLCQ